MITQYLNTFSVRLLETKPSPQILPTHLHTHFMGPHSALILATGLRFHSTTAKLSSCLNNCLEIFEYEAADGWGYSGQTTYTPVFGSIFFYKIHHRRIPR